jgi:uridylate kinase
MKPILLKVSGELFKNHDTQSDKPCMDVSLITSLIEQIKKLSTSHHFSIVIGGGNFFRGAKEGIQLGLKTVTADMVGMLATIMNGIILRDFFDKAGIETLLVSTKQIPGIVDAVNQDCINLACKNNTTIIFSGGTGNPFFTTDTASVLSALRVEAKEIWKATKVDHVYDSDPKKNSSAQPIHKLTYKEAIEKKLAVMDQTSMTLAQEHDITLRIFSLFSPNALLQVAQNSNFGSTIQRGTL